MTKILNHIPLLFLITLWMSCSANQPLTETFSYPEDLDQPFITLKSILGEESPPAKGPIRRLVLKITGPTSTQTLVRPVAVAVDGKGDVYVVDGDAARILRYHYENAKLVAVESFGGGVLDSPKGIAYADDIIYVSDATSGLIHRFDQGMKLMSPLQIQGLERPGQLNINPHSGELFIVDTPARQILVTNTAGEVKVRLNNDFIGKQLIKAPIAIDFTPEGTLVVLDGLTRRVELFSTEYKHLSGFGGYDRVPGSFSYPRGLAVSSVGNIFVADAAFGNVQVFDSNGTLLYFFGKSGKAVGEFLLPASLTFDTLNNLYVVDQYNNRIQVFHNNVQGR